VANSDLAVVSFGSLTASELQLQHIILYIFVSTCSVILIQTISVVQRIGSFLPVLLPPEYSVFSPSAPPSSARSLPSSTMPGAEVLSDSASLASLDSSVFFSEASVSCVRDPLDILIINVGGRRYMLSQELLASHPETRLGKLARCSRDSALELCDDANFQENEFFFDRSSQTFQ